VIDLNAQPLNQQNARRFLQHLETHFPDGAWEGIPRVNQEVQIFIARLNTLNTDWAHDIRSTIEESRSNRSALAVEVSPHTQ